MISDKALELNISLVLTVRGDSVECTGIQVIKLGGGLAGNEIDPQRAMTRIGKETSRTNGVPPWCVSHAHVSRKGPAQGAQHEEKKEEPIGPTADCRNTWIFKASSEFSDVRSAVRTLKEHAWLVQQHKEQIKLGDRVYVWESGPRGGIIGLAEVSEPPRIQPELKEQLLFIRNSEKSRGDRLRVKIRLLKLIEPAIQRTYLSSRAEFATLSILRRPRATNFRVTREEAKALESIVDGMAVAAAPHDSVQGEKRIVFATTPTRPLQLLCDLPETGAIPMTTDESRNMKDISASEYIRTNFHPSDRIAVLVRNGGTGETIQRIATAERIAGTSTQEWLQLKNEKEACDIYIGMNTLKPEARTRTKGDIQTIRHLYLDIDHDGPSSLAKIRQSNLVPPPNYTVNTSPDKFQTVWRVEGIDREHGEALLRAMARTLGGDPAATDSTRVLRLPGFINRKYQTDFRVQAEKHTDRIHHLQDFRLHTEPIDNNFRARYRLLTQRSSETRPLSQSEHDWIYAKRALARGDDPEEIIRRIANFRISEKSDPLYYARLTVSKAQQHLATEKATPTQPIDGSHRSI